MRGTTKGKISETKTITLPYSAMIDARRLSDRRSHQAAMTPARTTTPTNGSMPSHSTLRMMALRRNLSRNVGSDNSHSRCMKAHKTTVTRTDQITPNVVVDAVCHHRHRCEPFSHR